MSDSKFNVDDILRELDDKQQERPQRYGNQAYNQQPPPPPRRPAPTTDDSWEPVGSQRQREAPPPPQQRVQRPVQPPPERPIREIPRQPQPTRLGQQPERPRTREDMGRLLGNFGDSSPDPLENLDFLERQPQEDSFFGDSASSFTPSWDNTASAPPQPRRQEAPPQPYRQQEAPPPQRRQAAPPPPRPQQRPPQGMPMQQPEQPPRQPRPEGGFQRAPMGPRGDIYGGSIMQRGDRRNMADAARLLTGGGVEDFPEDEVQTRPPRGRQPAAQPQQQPRAQQRPMSHVTPVPTPAPAPVQYRPEPQREPAPQPQPRQTVRPPQGMPMQPAPPQSRFDKLDSLDAAPDFNTRQRPAPPRPAPVVDPIYGEPEDEPQPRAPRREPRERERREPPEAESSSMEQLTEQLTGMRNSLMIRVVVNLISMAAVIYLALAGSYDFPLPDFMAGAENAANLLWVNVALVALSALVSGNTVGGGILAIIKLRPSNDSYTSLTVFACLLQGAYMAMQPDLLASHGDNLYLPMAVFMLLFNTLGKIIMMSRVAGSFGLLTAKEHKNIAGIMDNREFARRISADIISDEPAIVYAAQTLDVDGFLAQALSESKAEDISRIVAPMAALASLVMALIAYLINRDIFSSACVFTAALCITSPLASVIACNLPLSITNGKLARWGASICGYDAVDRFSDANGVVLRASQIFPKGSVAIQDIQVLDRRPIDQIIVDAASVLCSCDSYLAPVFYEMIQDRSMLMEAENHEFFDGMGLAAWVGGRRILIGNRNLMLSYGVLVPDAEYERQYTAGGGEALYLANSGEASAIYFLTYRPDKNMRRTLQLICDSDMGVCIYSHDPTLTADRISQVYAFPKELLTVIPATMHGGTEKYLRVAPVSEAMAVHNGTPASYMRTVLAARSCNRCITLQTALLLMSVVLGFGIVTFFAFTGNMEALTWVTLTVFQFFWVLLELVVPLFKH